MNRLAPFVLALWVFGAAWGAEPRVSSVASLSNTGYDELRFIGWNNSCSCAVEYLAYPAVGEELQAFPERWDIGTLAIDPGKREASQRWLYRSEPGTNWDERLAASAIADIDHAGYTSAGPIEAFGEIREPRTQSDRTIRSPDILSKNQTVSWPQEPFMLRQIFYSPLATCALAVFRNTASRKDSFRYKLIRVLDPGARRARARAHVNRGLLFYENADIYEGLAELEIAVAMDPEYPTALYHRARLLATHGKLEDSLVDLGVALRLDAKFKPGAKDAVEFSDLRNDPRFKSLLKP